MRLLKFNEIEIVNGAENQAIMDSYSSAIGVWGTFGAATGAFIYPIMSYLEPASPVTNLLLTMAGQSAAIEAFAMIGMGFTVGATFGVAFYYLISNLESQYSS